MNTSEQTVISSWCHRPFFIHFLSFHNSSSAFCAPSGLDFILQSREQLQCIANVRRSVVQQKANLDEMQLPLDWRSHQMNFTLSWSILYTKRRLVTELDLSTMAILRPDQIPEWPPFSYRKRWDLFERNCTGIFYYLKWIDIFTVSIGESNSLISVFIGNSSVNFPSLKETDPALPYLRNIVVKCAEISNNAVKSEWK